MSTNWEKNLSKENLTDVQRRKRAANRFISKNQRGIEVDGETISVRVAARSGYLVGIKKRHRQFRKDPLELELN